MLASADSKAVYVRMREPLYGSGGTQRGGYPAYCEWLSRMGRGGPSPQFSDIVVRELVGPGTSRAKISGSTAATLITVYVLCTVLAGHG